MKASIVKREGNAVVKLKGTLDERSNDVLDGLAPKLKRVHVVFDCEDLGPINTLGFRLWTGFLKILDASATFEFTRCPQRFVEYLNLVPNMAFASRTTSLVVPFRCEDCSATIGPVHAVEELVAGDEFQPLICTECNGCMRAEVQKALYLSFLFDEPQTLQD